MDLVVSSRDTEQPALLRFQDGNELTAVIAGLALGGAEKIVLDWATRIYPKWKVHIIVLRDHEKEWFAPSFLRVTRLHGKDVLKKLKILGKSAAAKGNPVCLCHLLKENERNALSKGGAVAVPILHNAGQGWLEDASHLKDNQYLVAVSKSCTDDLRKNGWGGFVSVIRHIPGPTKSDAYAREYFRRQWNIPKEAIVIGMIGAFKLQKNYQFALRVFKALLEKKDAYLVIIGGPISRARRSVWDDMITEINRLGIRHRVAMPGFLNNADRFLPVFDILLNTSNYEGFSMATAEALISGMSVVASDVGGQGELRCDGLTLIPKDSPEEVWVDALENALVMRPKIPAWAKFPSYRLWTLASLAGPVKNSKKTLFVTANLNSGGAQRSLVNLSKAFKRKNKFEIAVAGNSTADYFFWELRTSGIKVSRASGTGDAFDNAESLVRKICGENIGTVCFWNLDPKVKLLLVKTLGFTEIRFIDVSPGNNAFDEMENTAEFQKLICFSGSEYYRRLNKLVLKYWGDYPSECEGRVAVIPNGVPKTKFIKSDYSIRGNPRVVVSGRIAPTKFLTEIVEAMKIVRGTMPNAELHIFGVSEPRHSGYAGALYESAKPEINKKIFFHGLDFDVVSRLPYFDAYAVLGKEQGCPNALLEAMNAGLPAVANDDGGTKEQVIHGKTGLLIKSCDPEELSGALLKILTERGLAQELGRAGRAHVTASFSMEEMCRKYISLFGEAASEANTPRERICRKMSSLFPVKTRSVKGEETCLDG